MNRLAAETIIIAALCALCGFLAYSNAWLMAAVVLLLIFLGLA